MTAAALFLDAELGRIVHSNVSVNPDSGVVLLRQSLSVAVGVFLKMGFELMLFYSEQQQP